MIHNKEYITVAERLNEAHSKDALVGVETEVLSHNPIVVKATVKLTPLEGMSGVPLIYTGISSVDPATNKLIEKNNPYEVAETSAVGRALGFAGYGLVESIASAEEIVKSDNAASGEPDPEITQVAGRTCETCGEEAVERKGVSKQGKPYHGIFCSSGEKTHTTWLND